MKRSKIMLTALAALAVVGTSLAFKAQRYTVTTLYTTNGGSQCTVEGSFKTTTAGLGTAIQASTTNTGACATFYTTTREN